MDWTEKFAALQGNRSVREIARIANVPESSLSTTVIRASVPISGSGTRIAKALGVTAEWLFDDSLGMDSIQYAPLPEPRVDHPVARWCEKVKQLRGDRPDEELAMLAGLDVGVLRTALKQRATPGSATGIRIAKALGVTAEWLFDDSLGLDEAQYVPLPSPATTPPRRVLALLDAEITALESGTYRPKRLLELVGALTSSIGEVICVGSVFEDELRRAEEAPTERLRDAQ